MRDKGANTKHSVMPSVLKVLHYFLAQGKILWLVVLNMNPFISGFFFSVLNIDFCVLQSLVKLVHYLSQISIA